MIRAHIIFTGTVQGVGFRYTVQRQALSLNLIGWVKNCPDGSVEAMIEGSKEDIECLCKNLEDYFNGYIQEKNIQYSQALNDFEDFQITT